MAILLKHLSLSSRIVRPLRRALHLICYRDSGAQGEPLESPEDRVQHVAVGVGGVVMYNGARKSSYVWYAPASMEPTRWFRLELPREGVVRSMAIGRGHIATLLDNIVYTAGDNQFGQCGYHGNQESNLRFRPLSRDDIKQVMCGLDHTLLLTHSGEVWGCGWSADGQTGVGHYDNVYEPISLDIKNVSSIHTCGDSSFAVTGNGEVYAWGNNEYGQLGVVTEEQQVSHPVRLELSDLDSEVVSIATGGAFTGVLTSQGSVYVAGYTIEDPNRCVREGRSIIEPHQLCRFRKLVTCDSITSLHGGLNYLVAGLHGNSVISHDLLVWGCSPLNSSASSNVRVSVAGLVEGQSSPSAFHIQLCMNSDVSVLDFGANEVVVLTDSKKLFDSPVFNIYT